MVSSFSVRMAIRSMWISFAKNLFSLLRSSHSFKDISSAIQFWALVKYKQGCQRSSEEVCADHPQSFLDASTWSTFTSTISLTFSWSIFLSKHKLKPPACFKILSPGLNNQIIHTQHQHQCVSEPLTSALIVLVTQWTNKLEFVGPSVKQNP